MILLAVICAVAAVYQMLALFAVLRQASRRRPELVPDRLPPISILKPVSAAEAGIEAALNSHAAIRHPDYEVLLGVTNGGPTISLPSPVFRVVQCTGTAPNAKVAKLACLAREARHAVLAINDADIEVPPEYLQTLAAELENAGLVTCLYRANGGSIAAEFEALGIATDFAPSALVAPITGVREFGLGSTLALRADTLRQLGGFEAIQDYIADDYQLGKRVSLLGLPVKLSVMVVSTWLGAGTFAEVWRHQVRWARTIRLSRGAYFGIPVTFATMWAAAAALAGWWPAAAGLLALRMGVGILCGLVVLRDPVTARLWWMIPLRDMFGVAVWAAGAIGSTVEWSGRRLQLDGQGRIISQ
ncbi:MAG TPA: glycosyltransferase [Bryobacteraceae bacterium]|nr:glycosyltransferase [Bryobacteraceae bacterium]